MVIVMLKDEFGKELLETIKKNYPNLYQSIDKNTVYFDWSNSNLNAENNGDMWVSVCVYNNKSNDYLGTLSFKFKMIFDKNRNFLLNKTLKRTVKYTSESK
jgi:hypothetical protein